MIKLLTKIMIIITIRMINSRLNVEETIRIVRIRIITMKIKTLIPG